MSATRHFCRATVARGAGVADTEVGVVWSGAVGGVRVCESQAVAVSGRRSSAAVRRIRIVGVVARSSSSVVAGSRRRARGRRASGKRYLMQVRSAPCQLPFRLTGGSDRLSASFLSTTRPYRFGRSCSLRRARAGGIVRGCDACVRTAVRDAEWGWLSCLSSARQSFCGRCSFLAGYRRIPCEQRHELVGAARSAGGGRSTAERFRRSVGSLLSRAVSLAVRIAIVRSISAGSFEIEV